MVKCLPPSWGCPGTAGARDPSPATGKQQHPTPHRRSGSIQVLGGTTGICGFLG